MKLSRNSNLQLRKTDENNLQETEDLLNILSTAVSKTHFENLEILRVTMRLIHRQNSKVGLRKRVQGLRANQGF